jgi:hypothetical protein
LAARFLVIGASAEFSSITTVLNPITPEEDFAVR